MATYTKLWSQIVKSTVWQKPNDFRVLWITLLALKDQDHIVRASIPGLAKDANITPEQCETFMEELMSPDKWSSTPDHEGRRIKRVEGGWLILNGEKYQDFLRAEHRRAAVRNAVAAHRERKKAKAK